MSLSIIHSEANSPFLTPTKGLQKIILPSLSSGSGDQSLATHTEQALTKLQPVPEDPFFKYTVTLAQIKEACTN